MDKIIRFDFGENFIDGVADFLLKNHCKDGYDLSRAACVFDGKRPSLFLCKRLSEKIKKPFLPPKIFSIDEFIEYIIGRSAHKSLSSLDNAYLIYCLVREHTPSMFEGNFEFCAFLPWAQEIISFIEQLDLEDIQNSSLQTVEKSAAIGYEVPESINILLSHIVEIRRAYHKVLRDKGFYSRGLAYLKASRKISSMALNEFDKVVFCNFFYPYATQERVIKEVCAGARGICIVQGSQKALPEVLPELNLSFYQGFDLHSQVCIVREILKNKIKDKNNTLIVVPRAEAVIPLLGEISPILEDFNISMGYPLKRSPFYVLFDALFKLQESKKQGSYYTKDYLNLLRHPLVKNLKFNHNPALRRVMIHKIEEIIHGVQESAIGGSLFLTLDQIENEEKIYELTVDTLQSMDISAYPIGARPAGVTIEDCKAALSQLHTLLLRAWDEVSSFSGFADKLNDLIEALIEKSAFTPLEISEYNRESNKKNFIEQKKESLTGFTSFHFNLQAVEKIQEIKDEFKKVSFSSRSFSQNEIWEIFRRMLQNEIIAFKGSPLRGTQILGFLEARSLNFDNVIIMDVNESVLPKLKIYEPLIPREVMLQLGLGRLEKEEEIQRYHFMRLIWSAKNAYLIYEENQVKEKSRFIEELLWNKQKKAQKLEATPVPKVSFSMKISDPQGSIKKTPQIIKSMKEQAYSASRVNTYLRCSLQFYYQYVLGLREREDLLDEPQAYHIGNFIHELLEEAFKEFKGRKPVIDGKFRKRFFEQLDEKFEKDISGRMRSDSFLLKGILVNRMEKFIDNEAQREVAKIICLEEKRKSQIIINNEPLDFFYTIDRIDELADGSIIIIDYKTGSANPVPKKLDKLKNMLMDRKSIKENIKSFQLPLYYYFISQEFPQERLNAELYNIRTLKRYPFIHKDDFDQKEKIKEISLKALSAVFTELFCLDIPFEPDKQDNKCRLCDFKGICG
ncbi:MAG: PD-(D/E)XK nuclease family protein [Candidatus Omnitrophota bacterium]